MRFVFIILIFLVAQAVSAREDPLNHNISDESGNWSDLDAIYNQSVPYTPLLGNTTITGFDDFMNLSRPESIPFARFLRNNTIFGNFSSLTAPCLDPPQINRTWIAAFLGEPV
ncbi:MAG: hypothetical protein D4Q77_01870 [Methanothrix sp.]|nr:MAG: hypothetical protein D4Q77_01870 [Methanothrix sp.]